MSEEPTGENANGKATRDDSAAGEEPLWTSFYSDSGYRPAQHKQNPEPPNWVEKLTLLVLVLTLIAAGYAGFEASRLARDTEESIEDARDVNASNSIDTGELISAQQQFAIAMQLEANNTRLLVEQAQRSAGYAHTSSDAAQGQLVAMNNEQRARIGVITGVMGPLNSGNPATMTLQYINSGKDIATDVHLTDSFKPVIAATVSPENANELQANTMKLCRISAKDSLLSNVSPSINGNSMSAYISSAQTPDIEKLNSKAIAFLLTGCFQYRTLGKIHHSGVCMYYLAGSPNPPNDEFLL